MKISEFNFTKENHFVAMEYYGLILNRTFLILITDLKLIGIKVHGLISVESHGVEAIITSLISVDGNLSNPYSYIKMKFIERIKDVDLLSDSFLNANPSNFIFERSDVTEVKYDKRKKWGMGYYPHDGRVYITSRDNSKREFIILGSQSGSEIERNLKTN